MKSLGVLALLAMAVATVLVGCTPTVFPADFGHVVYKIPRVPGTDTPYPLPELGDKNSSATPPRVAGSSASQPDRQTSAKD